jgi:hypothetical protein
LTTAGNDVQDVRHPSTYLWRTRVCRLRAHQRHHPQPGHRAGGVHSFAAVRAAPAVDPEPADQVLVRTVVDSAQEVDHVTATHMADYRRGLTREQLATLPAAIDIGTAAEVLGIGRSAAYELVRCGKWPTPVLRLGKLIRIPTRPLLELLGERRPD